MLSAAAASACCWLPLLLITFGVSAVGISVTFDRLRPWFLILATLLLGVGFYFNYFRRTPCTAESECKRPNPTIARVNRISLWFGTIAVAVFALFPNYAVALLSLGDASSAPVPGSFTTNFVIDGMTCPACAHTIEESLRRVPGVASAEVSYEDGVARVSVLAESPAAEEDLLTAVTRAGYQASPAKFRPQ